MTSDNPSLQIGRRTLLKALGTSAAFLSSGGVALGEDTNTKETLLAFGAHPADVLGSCGGTLAKHAMRGDRVVAAPLTLGLGHLWKPKQGGFGLLKNDQTRRLKTLQQAKEFYLSRVRSSYAELKPAELRLLDLADSPLIVSDENLRAVAGLIREVKPSIVMTHHPTVSVLAGHPDHRTAGDLVLRAIMFAMEETFQQSPYPPHVTSAIYCYPTGKNDRWQALGQMDAPNVYVDVSQMAAAKEKGWLAQGDIFGLKPNEVKEIWKEMAQPGYPNLEAFVRSRPVVVEYLSSNPGRPWLGA